QAGREMAVGDAKRMGLRDIMQAEHDMDIVFGYSDRIIALHQGKVLADATPAQIEADAQVMDMVVGRRRGTTITTPHPALSPEGRGGSFPSPLGGGEGRVRATCR